MSYADPAAAQPAMAEHTPFSPAASHRIRRPGQRPLVFSGTELAMAMSFTPELPYWYEMNIYRTDTQRFVLIIRLFFQSETEEDFCQAWDFDTLMEVFDAVESYDAGKDVKLPSTASVATPAEMMAMALELRAKTLAARAHFKGLVGELFEELDAATPAAA